MILQMYMGLKVDLATLYYNMVGSIYIDTFGETEKIKSVQRIHLPFGKLLASHLFSFALFICSNVVPCFLQKNLQENKLLFIIQIQILICMILLKDAADEKNLYYLRSTISYCNVVRQLLSFKKVCKWFALYCILHINYIIASVS